ncbi:hypothetical protein [Streptomyces sp. YGL11-2]|uniref:hypothetical protein n=1 Tax=Streptomyces sp. YGL11-2 TaxID=3414028 RepID=UPI003CE82291
MPAIDTRPEPRPRTRTTGVWHTDHLKTAPHQHQPDADDRQSRDPTNVEVDTGLAKLDLAGYCLLRPRRPDQAGDAHCDTSTSTFS